MIRPPRSSTTRPRTRASRSRRQHAGVVMVTCLFILLVITLLAVAMYRSTGLHEKIAGNTLEKERSFHAAESAVRYGEWWLAQDLRGAGGACEGIVDGNTASNMRVCAAALATPAAVPWANRVSYAPPKLVVKPGGGLIAGSAGVAGDVNYAGGPGLYIQYLGLGPDPRQSIYRVTGAAYGGVASTISVVQSTYAISARTLDLGGL